MVCPQCHQANPPEAAFCIHCGAPLPTAGTWAAVPEPGQVPSVAGASRVSPSSTPLPAPSRAAPATRPIGRFAPPSTPLTGALVRPPRRASPSRLDPIFGMDGQLGSGYPATRLQAIQRRMLGGQQVPGKWSSAVAGAVVAVVVGLVATALTLSFWGKLVPLLATPATYGLADQSLLIQIQLTIQTANPFLGADVLKMLMLAHGVPVAYQLGTSSATLRLPLTGFALLPAFALTLGGCLAGASDYQRRARFSIARGALIAPFYAVLLAICAFLSASPTNSGAGFRGGLITPSVSLAFLLGLVWGIIFGGLGGWIQLAGRNTLSALLPALRSAAADSRATSARYAVGIRAAVAGAVVAVGSGVLLSLVVCLAGFAFLSIHSAALAPTATADGGSSPLAGLGQAILLALGVGPLAAVWLFAFATGGPLVTTNTNLFDLGATQQASIGFLGAQHGVPTPLWYLLALLPAICYVFGGRVAARAWGARTARSGFLAGALIAFPAALLMAALAFFTALHFDAPAASAAETSSISLMAGVAIWRTLGATLVFALLCGALGGASAIVAPALGGVPRLVFLPLRPLGLALFPLFDRLTAHPRGQPRGNGRQWLYDSLLATLLFSAIAVLCDIISVAGASVLPYQQWALVSGIVAALTLGIPLLGYVCALAAQVTAAGEPMRVAESQQISVGVAGAPLSQRV